MNVRAMENWGCITFNDYTFLMDYDSTPSNVIIRNARTICHEISHMWFGNLVTMEWWTDIWLNEGFARFEEFCALDSIYPEYHIWDQFFTEVFVYGVYEDRSHSSHPIEVECYHPDDLKDIFDGIAYAKGASLIRMINQFLGPDVFKESIRIYLNKYTLRNTQTKDLWEVFEETSKNKAFTSMMMEWTKQKGFPILKTELISSSKDSQVWMISQTSCHKSDSDYMWTVPVPYVTCKGSKGTIILSSPYDIFTFPFGEDEVIKFNDNSTTF
mmetsp:Transcript_2135/g.2743  ORF Transcript_2135/g.2743 Transcript_2135/m.2743 type:complete len:270 (-) Transcript_2135:207-1016(-)